ncbi:MAG TPA: copper chaperone PCu(A)C [Alphaproteobacteria bacterium]
MTMTFKHLVLAVAVTAWLTPALAQSPQSGAIHVEGAWARPTPPTAKAGAAYMTVVNSGADDRLVSASTPIAGKAEVHETINDNGVMKMRPAGALEVKPGTPTKLQPGGLHLMLTELKAPLADGQSFPLTLVFEKAGKVETSVHVQRNPPTGAAAAPAMPMNMDHSKMGN